MVTEPIREEKKVLTIEQEIAAEQAAAIRSVSQAIWALVKVATRNG